MIYIVIAIFVAGVNGLLAHSFHKNNLSQKDCVALPKFYFYFGIAVSLLFTLPIIAYIADEAPFYREFLFWFFLCFIILLMLMALAQVNWRIYPNDEGFVHRNMFGIRRSYQYDRIKHIKHLKRIGDTIIKIKGRTFPIVVDAYAEGWDWFIKKYNKYIIDKRKNNNNYRN